MLKDIQIIGNGFQKPSFELLPESVDRLHACHYFCSQVQRYSTLKDETKARWYLRAALSGFRSTLDSLDGEIKIKLKKNLWRESKQEQDINKDVLVKMLTKIRNYAIHSSRISGKVIDYSITIIDDKGGRTEDVRSLFFDELNRKDNFRDASNVSDEEIKWFNRQAQAWPADLLIKEGLYQASTYLHHFCVKHGIA